MYTKSIDAHVKNLEKGKIKEKSNSYEEAQMIQNQLPLKTIDQLSHFDRSLEDENIRKAFVTFLERIGGTNAAENVKAILKRIFTNKLGTQCSWLGQRSNFKICVLSVIIKNVILSGYNEFQELHFRKTVSEWFRLSKLRLSREHTQVNADNPPKEN
ncbi:uncharacterized protein LOC113005725 isoform X2 [Solenopsis invicta]|nr:uncharacterized protein LOC113005725 isoform X2 [Solenopsis invicta]